MQIRLGLDICWRDLFRAFVDCMLPTSRHTAQQTALATWDATAQSTKASDCLVTLSVRSSFDLALRAMELPKGSEVLMSALTIPDMATIVRSHGLKPKLVDTNGDGIVDLCSLRDQINSNTRAMIVVHLFGRQLDLEPIHRVLRQYGIPLIEDNAQGFDQVGESGHPDSLLVLHSFGTIKTATCLGGGVARVRCPELRERMSELLENDPLRSRFAYLRKVLKCILMKSLTSRTGTYCVALAAQIFANGDWDRFIGSMGRGFSTTDLIRQIRQRPSTPLLKMLARRWRSHDSKRLDIRRRRAAKLIERLGLESRFPSEAAHNHWVFPIFVSERTTTKDALRRAGYDATWHCRMGPLAEDGQSCRMAQHDWDRVLFLPWNERVSIQDATRMAAIIQECEFSNQLESPDSIRESFADSETDSPREPMSSAAEQLLP